MTKPNTLKQPVTVLSGIGNRTADLLAKLGITTCQDLLFHLPVRYEDKTRLSPIASLAAGTPALICGQIDFINILLRGRKSLICRISDKSGIIDLRFFHFTANQHNALKPGTTVRCFGEVRYGYAGLEMVHPEYTVITNQNSVITETHLTPVYPLTEGLNQSVLRKAVSQVLSACSHEPETLIDWLPNDILNSYQYPSLLAALNILHSPNASINNEALQDSNNPARQRLVCEELLAYHLRLRQAKSQAKLWHAPRFSIDTTLSTAFLKALPFDLTQAQHRVINEISTDCNQPQPMMRLVQGDVGSGKTIVAAYAALLAVSSGFQVAIMAPTELLAEQHWRNFQRWFQFLNAQIVYLTGQIKGTIRKEILPTLADGSAAIIIGTHALFQDDVKFKRLGLIIIDEQHRFGVQQRLALRTKGQQGNSRPHQLVMTATPIPRTLAMLQYSDLNISIIDELPPGRKQIATSVIPGDRREDVIQRINTWIKCRKQAYWVCTLIEESDVLQYEAAENTAQYLSSALPDVRIALLHGRLKNTEKDSIMLAFKNHELDLLVATTVIEVGVDVPNASLMIIENPERLGLSQLHQLRGRVGRGVDDSFCLLMYQSPLSDTARQRLAILRESNDGFYIAEKDLQLRGPGEVMGTRQTGQLNFKIADLVRDADLLDNIPHIADTLIAHYPEHIVPLIERWLHQHSDYTEV